MTQNCDEDSYVIEIEAPPQKETRVNQQILKDSDIKTNADHQKLSVYCTINSVYIRNLITRKQRPNIPSQIRSKYGATCIFYKQFIIDSKQAKLFYGKQESINGSIIMIYNSQLNVQFKVHFQKDVKKIEDFIWISFNYSSSGIWKSKSYSLEQDSKRFFYKVPIDQFNDFLEPNLLLTINLRKKQTSNTHQLGIINLGNTCFMNSCLQMLFYIRPLRKIILQTKSRNRIIKALRDVFIMLLDTDQKKPVDVQILLQSYEKYNQHPRNQQDVQQFLLDFINEIQQQCPQVKSLWQGKCSQTTYSLEKGKQYESTQDQQFAQLDVHLFDRKMNFYTKIEESLHDMMQQEQVEQMIQNDKHGKIKVAKYRKFLTLPDVLFVNLKRYQWNKEKMRLSKIFSHIEYGENLNLGFIVGTPGNTDINPDCDYTLFSVLVHKGTSPQNGHYFVFVNTSDNCQRPDWISFNDSIVTKSDEEEVMEFTGKKKKQTVLQKNIGRFLQKDIESDASSYLLVYIRKAVFDDFQSIKTPIPKSYISQKLKKNAQKQKQSLQDINVFVIDHFDESVDIFDNGLDFIPIPLQKNGSVRVELKKVSKQVLGADPKYLYRIYTTQRKVKLVQSYETAADIVKFRRGFSNANYILILSDKIKYINGNESKSNQGIVKVLKNQLEDQFKVPQLTLATPQDIKILQQNVIEKGGRINYFNQKQDFDRLWNRYLEIEILKDE